MDIVTETQLQEKFFPFRSAFGKESDCKGIYINSDYLIFQNHKDRDHQSTVFIPRKAISQAAHIAKFRFMFLIFVYYTQAINRVVLFDSGNNALGIIDIVKMKPQTLVNFLTELQALEPQTTFDKTLSTVIEEKKFNPISKNYWKAVWKGMRFWIIIPVILAIFAIILGIISSALN